MGKTLFHCKSYMQWNNSLKPHCFISLPLSLSHTSTLTVDPSAKITHTYFFSHWKFRENVLNSFASIYCDWTWLFIFSAMSATWVSKRTCCFHLSCSSHSSTVPYIKYNENKPVLSLLSTATPGGPFVWWHADWVVAVHKDQRSFWREQIQVRWTRCL